jgi:hypothetical protein
MRFLWALALLVSACAATPDLEYAPDDDAGASDAGRHPPPPQPQSPPPKQCLQKEQRCTTGTDCCSGHCKLKDDEALCD